MLSSLRGRLLIGLLPPLTVLLACGCGWLYWYQKEMMQRDFDQTLARATFDIMRRIPRHGTDIDIKISLPAPILFAGSWNVETDQQEWLVAEDGITPPSGPISPLPKNGKQPYGTVTLDGRQVRIFSVWAPPRRMRRTPKRYEGRPTRRPTNEKNGDNLLDREPGEQKAPSSDVPPPPEQDDQFSNKPPRQRYIVQSAADMAPMRAALRSWLINLLFMAGGGEILVIVVVLLAVRRGLKPLGPLATEIASISDANLARRVRVEEIPREIQPVVQQVNEMLERLEAAFVREQSFIANAAHELRTPLAGMRTQLEVSLRRERPAEESRQTIKDILDEAKSLQSMLDTLLVLSRLDAGQIKPVAEPVDVTQMLQGCWQNFAPHADERGVQINWQIDDSLMLEIDRILLERIINNLLSNAAEYAESSEPVLVIADRQGQIVSIRISNAATSLTDKDVKCMFDRFWRKDESHSDVGHHAGLGLSLVQQCVHALSGQIKADLNDGRLTITVTFPS